MDEVMHTRAQPRRPAPTVEIGRAVPEPVAPGVPLR